MPDFNNMPEMNICLLLFSVLVNLVLLSGILMAAYNYCLIGFVREKKEVSYRLSYLIGIICVIYVILSACSLFNGMFFGVDANGSYEDGWGIYISYILDMVLFIIEIIQKAVLPWL